MKIVVLCGSYPTKKYKISGIFAFDQAVALSRAGHDVCFASVDMRSVRKKRRLGFYTDEASGIKIYNISLPFGGIPQRLLEPIGTWCFDFLYKKMLRDGFKPDIVHAHFYDKAMYAANVKDKYGFKFVITEHYSKFVKKQRNIRSLALYAQRAYKKADKVLAVSKALADMIYENCGITPEVVANVADTKIFSPREHVVKDKKKFISVGRLSEEKNFSLLINAFAQAYNKCGNISLDIYGEGVQRKSLESLIEEKKLDGVVKLCGFADRSTISDALSAADCFILLSDYETFGVVYIEAIAAGVPVIATSCGGPEDFIDDSNGILIECGNVEKSAEAILYMCDNHSKYDAEAISESIKSRFSPEVIAGCLEMHYNSLKEN